MGELWRVRKRGWMKRKRLVDLKCVTVGVYRMMERGQRGD